MRENSAIMPASWRGSLAQLVEQRTLNPLVEGSNPSRPTNKYAVSAFFQISENTPGYAGVTF